MKAIQRTQFRAKNAKNDLNPKDLVKRNFCFEMEGVCFYCTFAQIYSTPLILLTFV